MHVVGNNLLTIWFKTILQDLFVIFVANQTKSENKD